MSQLGEIGQYLFWVVTGAVGIITEGVRRIHTGMTSIQEENEAQAEKIEQMRKHLGLDEDLHGPGRLDYIERDINDIGDTLDRHEVYWVGDPNDPSQLGALGNLHEIRMKLYRMDDRSTGEEDD